jgi:hypothetical protein
MNESKYQKLHVVSCDPGNGGTNSVIIPNGKPKFDYFPSVRAQSLAVDLGNVGMDTLKYETYGWYGQQYVVGNDVVTVTGRALERHQGRNRYGNEFHAFLVMTALSRLGVPDGEVVLTLFAPPGMYQDAKKAIKRRFEGKTFELTSRHGKRRHTWEVVKVNTVPEGVGAAAVLAFDNYGQPVNAELLAGRVALIDVGAYTTDVLVLENGALNPESIGHATLANAGIRAHVIEPVLADLHAQAPDLAYVGIDHIDMLLQNSTRSRTLETGGYTIDLKDDLEHRFELFAGWLANNVIDTQLNGLDDFNRLILVGGGALMVGKYIQRWYKAKYADLSSDPQTKGIHPAYFNVVGGARMTLNQLQGV